MAQSFKETAHLKTDLEKYQRSYDHIFNKEKCPCEECEELRKEEANQNNSQSRHS